MAAALGMPSSHINYGEFDVQADSKPAGKGSIANVFKGIQGRVMHDADVRSAQPSGFDKVFGNAAFDDEDGPAAPMAMEPGAVKMNNLFDERKKRQADQHRAGHLAAAAPAAQAQAQAQAAQPQSQAAEEGPRGPSIMGFFRKTASPNSTLRSDEPLGTLVQAFHAEDMDAPGPSGDSTTLSNERVLAAWEVEVKQMVASGMRSEAMQRPAPSQGLIRCYIKRSKSMFSSHTAYEMYLEAGDVFLLAARRRKKSKASAYVISQDPEDLKRDTDNCVAKLKANFVGTEYMLWSSSDNKDVRKGYATESLCVSFQNIVGKKSGPRVMHVVLPVPESGWQPSAADGADCLSNSLAAAKARELPPFLESKMTTLCSKAAEYNEVAKGYTLDFGGRVKEASVKNFQLVSWAHNTDRQGSDILLQFGKVDANTFALDFAYPMSIETAFACALASIDTKLCCAV